jgi:alkanesulfonate monooxygenase SsuD/methylene tetrahydromethanopterin reductase-like flavin-dependent oxidoreductase (luciferase family)
VAATAEVILTNGASLSQGRARYRAFRDAAESRGRPASGLRILADLTIILDRSAGAAERRAAELDALCPSADPPARFVGTPEQLVELFAVWQAEGACEGFNLKPAVLPDDLDLLVEVALPLAQRRGLARPDYAGATLREHFGLPRPRSQYEQAS